ncbi:MAG: CpsD/CapB family tyrosine-protein kinase [Ruminococcus sp.]|nr:CpsD/CapB family tyrosine-protein kinase [Ruminococcus sp.]
MSIKKSKHDSSTKQKRVTMLDTDLPFAVTEAFKALRTNIMFALSTRNSKIFAISSALPSEGKSTIAANLAITFAQTDSKVLFIDADLRKPVSHRTFGLKNNLGLSTLLGGIDSFREVLNSQVVNGLDVITSGPIPPNPSEMLGSENMKVLLDKLSAIYDYIIIDTPPINIVSDTLNLLPYIAGVCLVARQGITPNDAFEEAVNAIKFADGYVLGAIMGQVQTLGKKSYKKGYYKYGRYSKYGYGYEYGYGYGNNPKPELKSKKSQPKE